MIFKTRKKAEKFLRAGNVFYLNKPRKSWGNAHKELNMNDTFGWALAYGAIVEDEHMIEVAELFWRYGMPGLHYWCTIHPNEEYRMECSDFEDVQRGIDFVRQEEKIRNEKTSYRAAFDKVVYTLGERN